MNNTQADTLIRQMFKWIGSFYDLGNQRVMSIGKQDTIGKVAVIVCDTAQVWQDAGDRETAHTLREAYHRIRAEYIEGKIK